MPPQPPMPPVKRGDFWSRAKKNLTSRTLNSKLGRKGVTGGLGPHENAIISAVKSAVSLYKNSPECGREAKKLILRTAAKVKIMDDEGVLTGPEVQAAAGPINDFGVCFLWFMERASTAMISSKRPTPIDVTRLVTLVEDVRKCCIDVLRPLITEKNISPVDELLMLLGSHDFLDLFFNDQRFQNDRAIILHSVNALLEPFSEHFSLERTCSTYGCVENCCVVCGGYSDHCTEHHQQQVKIEMDCPTAKLWLSHPDKNQIFT